MAKKEDNKNMQKALSLYLSDPKMTVKEIYLNGIRCSDQNDIENKKYNNIFFIVSTLCNSLLIDSSNVQGDSLEKALYIYALNKF